MKQLRDFATRLAAAVLRHPAHAEDLDALLNDAILLRPAERAEARSTDVRPATDSPEVAD